MSDASGLCRHRPAPQRIGHGAIAIGWDTVVLALGSAAVLQIASIMDAQAEDFCTNCNVRPLDHEPLGTPAAAIQGLALQQLTLHNNCRVPHAVCPVEGPEQRVPGPPGVPRRLLGPRAIGAAAAAAAGAMQDVLLRCALHKRSTLTCCLPCCHSIHKLWHVPCACCRLQSTAGVTLHTVISRHRNASHNHSAPSWSTVAKTHPG
jgi:hypothetical protein